MTHTGMGGRPDENFVGCVYFIVGFVLVCIVAIGVGQIVACALGFECHGYSHLPTQEGVDA